MSKQEFLVQLRKRLSGLPQDDLEERISFYSEMIADRMEEGLSEKEAVLSVGSVDKIAGVLAPVKKKTKRLKAVEIVLLVLGSPVWLALLIVAAAVVFSFYVSVWAVIISLWAVFGVFVVCCPGGIAVGVIFNCTGNALAGIAMIGAGVICAGISIFMFYGCKAVTKGALLLTKKMAICIKNCFIKKEAA